MNWRATDGSQTSETKERIVAGKYQAIILLGLPGVGKGTQGRVLGAVPGYCYLGFGDILRSLDRHSELGGQVFASMKRGELVPDPMVIEIWKQHLEQERAAGRFHPQQHTLVLDGIPRTVAQAEALEEHIDVATILYLTCYDEQTLVRRIQDRARKEQRPDDSSREVILHRLQVYRQSTAPVLDFYPSEIVREVDSLRTPLDVLDQIIHVLLEREQRSAGAAPER